MSITDEKDLEALHDRWTYFRMTGTPDLDLPLLPALNALEEYGDEYGKVVPVFSCSGHPERKLYSGYLLVGVDALGQDRIRRFKDDLVDTLARHASRFGHVEIELRDSATLRLHVLKGNSQDKWPGMHLRWEFQGDTDQYTVEDFVGCLLLAARMETARRMAERERAESKEKPRILRLNTRPRPSAERKHPITARA